MATVSYSSNTGIAENSDIEEEIQSLLHLHSLSPILNSNLSGSDSGLDEGDVFQCGKCKKRFTAFSAFLSHKKGKCQAQAKNEAEDSPLTGTTYSLPLVQADNSVGTDSSNRPIILSESGGILSFTVQSECLNVPTESQSLQVFTSNEESQYIENTLAISTLKTLQIVETENGTQTSTLSGHFLVTEEKNNNVVVDIVDESTNETGSLSLLGSESSLEDIYSKQSITKELDYKMKCSFCGKLFRKKFDLQQHIRSHTKERPFQCIVCGRTFTQKSNVMKHMATHKVWPTKLLTLPKNSTQSNSESDGLPVQNKISDGEMVKIGLKSLFVCQYCPCVFPSFKELKFHRKTHSSQKVYKCIQKECSAFFEDLDSFLKHIQCHTNEALYRCHMCCSEFNSLHDLAVHQNFHHSNNKSSTKIWTCRKCKSKFSSLESLEQHLAIDTHCYSCSICEKVFTCERFLRRHLVTHSTGLSVICPVCHKSFRTEQYLNIHKIIHSPLKPFHCKMCSAKFNRKDKLSRHCLIHEKVKRFKCPFNKKLGCRKEFSRKDKWKEHILTHDSSHKNPCYVCSDLGIRKVTIPSNDSSVPEQKSCTFQTNASMKQENNAISEETSGNRAKVKSQENKNGKDDVPTIEIVVMPILGSADRPDEATFGVMFPSDGPIDLSQPMGILPHQEVPIYTIKSFK